MLDNLLSLQQGICASASNAVDCVCTISYIGRHLGSSALPCPAARNGSDHKSRLDQRIQPLSYDEDLLGGNGIESFLVKT